MENIGRRDNEGKPNWGLVDFKSLEPMVRVLMFGASKYEDHNWRKGLKHVGVMESLLRHCFAWLSGEENDPESGISHIGHIQCNALFLANMVKNHPELDDRYKPVVEEDQPDDFFSEPTCSNPPKGLRNLSSEDVDRPPPENVFDLLVDEFKKEI